MVVLEMDPEARRLSLGHKQLEENPWDVFESIYTVGSIHEGTVLEQHDKGVTVGLQGVEGFAFNKGLQREDGTTIKVGDKAEFKVIDFSKENKKIVLSHSRIWQDRKDADKEQAASEEEKKAKEDAQYLKKMNEKIEHSTLGDLDALINLKADLEAEAAKKKEEKAE